MKKYISAKILWVEYLKLIGILAVILGHITSPFGTFIYSWHMPLFFIIAGFFIDIKLNVIDFLLKNFRRLMIPYFIFAMIGICAETIKRVLLHRESLNYIYELQGILLWMDMPSLLNTYSFVLWFLPSLFFSKFIVYVVNKFIKTITVRFFIIFSIFYLSFFINLPFAIDDAFNASLFIFIGSIIYKIYQNSNLYLIILASIFVLLFFNMPVLDMANKIYWNPFINIIWSIAIISLFVFIFKKISYNNYIINLMVSNTMLLFIIHPYTNNIASIAIDKICSLDSSSGGGWYLKFIISVILLLFILLIKQKNINKGIFKYV